jgi:hypothetical protein
VTDVDDQMFRTDVRLDDRLTEDKVVAITDRLVVVDAAGAELDMAPPMFIVHPPLPEGARLRVVVDVEVIS